MKKFYNYSGETGEFVSEGEPVISPGLNHLPDDNPEKWLIPANTTKIKPPKFSEGEVPIWKNDKWVIEKDLRGQISYHKKTGGPEEIRHIGDVHKDFCLLPKPSEDHEWSDEKNNWQKKVVDIKEKENKEKNEQRIYEMLIDRKSLLLDDKLVNWSSEQIDEFVENADIDQLKEVIAGLMKRFAYYKEE